MYTLYSWYIYYVHSHLLACTAEVSRSLNLLIFPSTGNPIAASVCLSEMASSTATTGAVSLLVSATRSVPSVGGVAVSAAAAGGGGGGGVLVFVRAYGCCFSCYL